MPLPNLSPEVKAMRLRLRHIHIPDRPPLYAPPFLAPKIRDHIEGQIKQTRAVSEPDTLRSPHTAGDSNQQDAPRPFSRPRSSLESWLKHASPPPTVLSFTRRPTYILPKHQLETKDSWEADYLTKALKRRMQVKFFEPPTWSPLPWMSFWEHSNLETGSKLEPLRHEWPEADVMVLPCAEPMYLGPGQVSMWPIMNLRDDIQRGKTRFRTEYEYERVLEDTTIEVLKREYGIEAFAVPGTAGVWVESKIPPPELDSGQSGLGSDLGNMPVANRRDNIRRIATIHADITDDITRWGVSIHVGQPDPVVDSWTSLTNPWTRLRQHTTTTSIVAELAHSGSSPRHASRTRQLELWSHKKTRYLQTYFDKDAPFSGTLYHSMPYSLIKVQGGRREAAPLGLDNRDLSTAWTYEFARQLGMHDGFVDHYSVVDFAEANSTDLPTKTPSSGFMSRPMLDEHWLTHPYNQVDVPSLRVGKSELVSTDIMEDTMRLEAQDGKIDHETHEGWMLSWPLWYDTLMKRLDQSIAGGAWDTRLRAHMWEKEQSARQLRRKAAVKEAEDLEQRWGVQLKQLIRRPLTDEIIRELADKAREMERTLREVPAGAAMSKDLLESAAHMRRLLESRFPRQPQTGVEGHKLAGADTLEEVLSQLAEAASRMSSSTPASSSASSPQAASSPSSHTAFLTPPDKSPNPESTIKHAPSLAWSKKPAYAGKTNTWLQGSREVLQNDRNRNENEPLDWFKEKGKRAEFVQFTETRNEQFQKERRQKGREKAEARRRGQPDAITARPVTTGGTPRFLPRTQHIGSG